MIVSNPKLNNILSLDIGPQFGSFSNLQVIHPRHTLLPRKPPTNWPCGEAAGGMWP